MEKAGDVYKCSQDGVAPSYWNVIAVGIKTTFMGAIGIAEVWSGARTGIDRIRLEPFEAGELISSNAERVESMGAPLDEENRLRSLERRSVKGYASDQVANT